MTRSATIYARASDPASLDHHDLPRLFEPDRIDGRWTRVLRACCRTPITACDINRLVRKHGPDRTSRTEKRRTWRAVSNLVRLGLLRHDADCRYVATGAGLSALAEVREAA